MKKLLLVALLLTSNLVRGDAVGIIGPTAHFGGYVDTIPNNDTYGIYYTTKQLAIGRYYNSYNEYSNFVAYITPISSNLTLSLGIVDGYEKDTSSISGMLPLTTLSYTQGSVVVSLGFNSLTIGLLFEL